MKKILLLTVVFFLLSAGAAVYAQEPKIGIADLFRALNESDNGKKAKSDLEFLIKTKQSIIDEKGKSIEKLKADIDKQSSVLSAEARKSKEEELERLLRDYQRLVTDSQNEVKKKENEVTGEILKELRGIIQKIGQDEGYTLILEKAEGVVLFSKKEFEITDRVIQLYNSKPKK